MQFLEVQRADVFFFAKSVKKVQLEIHTKWNPTYNHTVITVLISCTYLHSLKSVYYYCSLYYSMQFLKFNEQTQGQTWLDAFFVQSRNRIRKKFNLKAFTYYLRLQKSHLYIFPNWISFEFYHFWKFNEMSQGLTWLDSFFVQNHNGIRRKLNLKAFIYFSRRQKIVASSVRSSIENILALPNLLGWKFRIKINLVYRLSPCNVLEVKRANSRSRLFCTESL